ncbi:MAG: hypothetical protein L6R41_000350 [Letrouitia leprolyta]|nr:MAG: hypothetical protein L6R41_000350 [Letrouitia leprolyta]
MVDIEDGYLPTKVPISSAFNQDWLGVTSSNLNSQEKRMATYAVSGPPICLPGQPPPQMPSSPTPMTGSTLSQQTPCRTDPGHVLRILALPADMSMHETSAPQAGFLPDESRPSDSAETQPPALADGWGNMPQVRTNSASA